MLITGIAMLLAAAAMPASAQTAAELMSTPTRETAALAADTGRWDVLVTMWPSPGAKPQITRGIVAERRMVGNYLAEDMHPAGADAGSPFHRLDYLYYSRVERRWQYVSMDTRLPVGIMPATSFSTGSPDALTFQFEPLAFAGFGKEVEGRMMRADMTITRDGPDHMVKEQRFVLADGKSEPWTAVRYDYRRAR